MFSATCDTKGTHVGGVRAAAFFKSGRIRNPLRKLRTLAAIGLCVSAFSGIYSGTALAQQTIRIGILLSATGPAAAAGVSAAIGVRMAVDEINRSGGILGRQLEVVQADDQGDTNAAVAEALRLTSVNKVDYLVGPQQSQLAIAIAPTLNKAGVVWVTTTTAADRLTTQFAPRHFSLLYTAETQAVAFANAIQAGKYKSVAILGDNGSGAQSTITVLRPLLKERGIELTGERQWNFGDTDMTAQALALRRGNPGVLLVYAGTGKDGGHALKSLEEIGWRVPVIGTGTFAVQPIQAQEVSGPEPLKRITALLYTGMSACPGEPLGQGSYAQLLVKLQKMEPANYNKISFLNVATGYDWIYMLKYAATGAASLNGDKMTAWVEQNASSMKLIYSPVRASKTDHFMLGPDALTPGTDVANPRSDGMMKRFGC